MKAIFLYRPNSEEARKVEDYAHDFERTQRQPLELMNMDSAEGINKAKLYDLMQNPSLIVVREDGQLVKHWEGTPFPLMSELAGYLNS